MINRGLATLPFPPTSYFSHETVKQIKAIPDDEIKYTEEEVAWLKRALQNLDYMIGDAAVLGADTTAMLARRAQVEEVLAAYEKQKR